MKTGCLVSVLCLAASIAAYYVVLAPYTEWPANAIAPAIGGFAAFSFLSGIYNWLRAYRQTRRLGDQPQVVANLQDGEEVAISGAIRPINAPLQAPLSGTPCVAYDYDIMHRVRRETGNRTVHHDDIDIAGLALTPSVIDTPTGSVRLLSFALLEDFPRTAKNDPALRARARDYIASTTFKPMGLTKVFSAFGALKDALTDEDGAVRMDWRMTPGDIELERAVMRERLVTPGQQVTAIGIYSAERRGLIAKDMSTMIQLRPGGTKDAQRLILRQSRSSFVAGLVLLLVTHGMGGAFLYLSETRYKRAPTSEQESALRIAIQNTDVEGIRRVIRQGVNPNVTDANGNTLLHDLRDADMVKVLTGAGAFASPVNKDGYTPLMIAARQGNDAVVAALIAAGAAPNQARADGATALSDAIEGGHQDVIARLVADRATTDLVTAESGTSLPADGGEPMQTVRAYLKAIHARDIPALYAACLPRPKGFFEGTDFDVWHQSRPEAPVFVEGFTNGTAATVTIGGPTIAKWPFVWHYQLVYKGEVWRIAREWDTETGGTPAPAPPAPRAGPAEPVERPRQ
jgi:hypothetical protein